MPPARVEVTSAWIPPGQRKIWLICTAASSCGCQRTSVGTLAYQGFSVPAAPAKSTHPAWTTG